MAGDTVVWIGLLIIALLQVHLASASPLPSPGTHSRIPGKYRNHNNFPGRGYGTFEIEFYPEGMAEDSSTSVAGTGAVQPSVAGAAATSPTAPAAAATSPTAPAAAATSPTAPPAAATSPTTPGSVPTNAPAASNAAAQTSTTTPAAPAPSSIPTSAAPVPAPAAGGSNIFVAIDSGMPPPQITPRGNHPQQGVGLVGGHSKPIETNKFYANWLLGDQSDPVFTLPFSLAWAKGGGTSPSYGIGVSHIDANQRVYGPGNPASYFINPIGLNSIILSAAELQANTALTTADHAGSSLTAGLAVSSSAQPIITFPVVQGMSMLTANYSSGTVAISTVIGFTNMSSATTVGSSVRYIVSLNNGINWAIYMTPTGSGAAPTLTLNGQLISGPAGYNGLIQVAKLGAGSTVTAIYDAQVGAYPTGATVSGTTSGTYSLAWQKGGDTTKTLAQFALPHHLESFASDTATGVTTTQLACLTKGTATIVVADTWNLVEQMPTTMGFAPWSPTYQSVTSLPASAMSLIQTTLAEEIGADWNSQTDLPTFYFSGKALGKVASLTYLASTLAQNTTLAATGLQKLEASFDLWVSNQAAATFVYDTTWGGIVSSAGLADSGADFGNGYYNDHMFHYGYFVYAASVIATLDPSWLTKGTNKAFVDSLIRDYANPVTDDQYFPFSRCFDWYNGHSWAAGLFVAGDGKNLESTSEDTFASFGIKMWGKATGDANTEARGNLMLAVEARALNDYFLYQSNNTVEPANFIGNKVSGILFDNKIDHTTYFGTKPEYIEGIHMIPIGAHSGLSRKPAFVSQEWSTYFDNGRANAADESWRALLYGNLALIDPVSSWNWFAQSGWSDDWLDNGASRSWYLAIAAALGGVS